VPTDLAAVRLAVATHRLASGAPAPAAPIRVDRDGWRHLAPSLSRQRLTGLASSAAAAGALELASDDLADLAHRDREVQAQALRAERLTLALCTELAEAGIEHRVLKGPACAHGVYEDPALRPFIDVDLLVRGDELGAVVARCERKGAVRHLPELRRGFDRRFAKSVTMTHPTGVEIDLHRTLALGPFSQLVALTDLWNTAGEVEVLPGRAVPTLDDDVAFLHACLHVSTGGRARLLSLRDVVETARRADLSRGRHIARGWRATAAVHGAIEQVRTAGLPVPTDLARWSNDLHPEPDEVRAFEVYRPEVRNPRSLSLEGWRYVRGIGRKGSYAFAIALPSRANRRARGRSVPGQARRVLRRTP
jgi:hypothetical protein